ncbi:hypothetical protein V1525DRAFT_407436 [Lipomyces kononenkoae]|uniref:Uncharacterized protein n=1 Tax=Lipomyces kononenkoae TaxID=34357 RepID=A0ACC3SY00_LIPKO
MSADRLLESIVGVLLLSVVVSLFGLYGAFRKYRASRAILLYSKTRTPPLRSIIQEYMGPTQLTRLPVEIFTNVAVLLTVRDLCALETSCRAIRRIVVDDELWEAKVVVEFGSQSYRLCKELKERVIRYPWKAIYAAMALQWKFFCADEGWGVIWRQPQYWDVQNAPESEFGKTLNLGKRSVWWLHVFRNIRIAPGVYRLVWAVHILPTAHGIASVEFSVRIADEDKKDEKGRPERLLLSSTTLGNDVVRAIQAYDGWVEVEMAEFDIPPATQMGNNDWQTILVEIRETGQSVKSGLNLDYIRLERVDGQDPFTGIHISPYSDHGNVLRLSDNAALLLATTNRRASSTRSWTLADVVQDLKWHVNKFEESSGLVY